MEVFASDMVDNLRKVGSRTIGEVRWFYYRALFYNEGNQR